MKFNVGDPVRIVSENVDLKACDTGKVIAVATGQEVWPYAVLLDGQSLPEGVVVNSYYDALNTTLGDEDEVVLIFSEDELRDPSEVVEAPVVSGFSGSKLWGALKGMFK